MKKFLTVFLALLLTSFVSVAYAAGHQHCVCGTANCSENHEETGISDWQAWSGDLTVGTVEENSETTAVYLYLENNVTITDTLEIKNVTVFLCLNGKTLTINKDGAPAVRVCDNQKFVLCDCVGTGKITGAKGKSQNDKTHSGAVNCQAGSFVMYGGSIADNNITGTNGGGVFVNGGTFIMHGGSIKNNTASGSGGAVSVENGTMYTYGGEMTGNSAKNGGAIHLKGNTKADIRGIKANNNAASNIGGGIYTESGNIVEFHDFELGGNTAKNGGGIYINGNVTKYVPNLYMNIYNPDIHDNTAESNGGGVYINGGGIYLSVTIYDANIHDNIAKGDGGGIYASNYANVNLQSGTIKDNKSGGNGGGIRMCVNTYFSANATENNVYIKGNSAKYGGGVYTRANSFVMSANIEIEGNTATSMGGGIYIAGNSVWLTIKNAKITKNTAPVGGGVCLNKENSGYDLEFGGSTSIIENTSPNGLANNLYIRSGNKFQFSNGISDSARIGVSVSEKPTAGNPIDIEYKSVYPNVAERHADGDHSELIIPDNGYYSVIYEDERHKLTAPTLELTADVVCVFNLNKPAVLFVASYNENKLLDIAKINLSKSAEKMWIADLGLSTSGASRVKAFLWGDLGETGNMYPVCESAATSL